MVLESFFQGITETILNPLFSPLLSLPPWASIAVIAFVVSLLVTVIYKYTTDQNLMKSLKQEMKELQKEMKELKSRPEKMGQVNSRFMETNMKYLMGSMKSTIFTILPVILIFGWLNAHLAYSSLHPGVPFEITAEFADGAKGTALLRVLPENGGLSLLTNQTQQIVPVKRGSFFGALSSTKLVAKWSLQAAGAGEYTADVTYGDESRQADILITEGREYKKPVLPSTGAIRVLTIGNERVTAIRFGNAFSVGWFGTYIIFAILFSIGLRRLMKLS